MRILHINNTDIKGGAAKAAFRLHNALLSAHIDSQMLVNKKFSNEQSVISTSNNNYINKLRQVIDNTPIFFYKNPKKIAFSLNWLNNNIIIDQINHLKPDIIHLHWINGGMFSLSDLSKLNIPIVWSLHDMWLFTGGCHYNKNCRNFTKNCGYCNILDSRSLYDLSYINFKEKIKKINKIKNLTVIALSSWLTDEAKLAIILKNIPIINYPNLIDINQYAPIEKKTARAFFNLPIEKKLILFGAVSATDDPRKGFKELSLALKKIDPNAELVIFGNNSSKINQTFKQKIHCMGSIENDEILRFLYSAADVTLVPSLQENLSNTIMESLSCGTPVVAFNIGGNKDMIDHKINGYLAKFNDISDLAEGIKWILNNLHYEEISCNSRKKILKNFKSDIVVEKYINLYSNILN